jgi:hypothetical protein
MTSAMPAGFVEGLPPNNTKCVIEYESGLRMYAEIQTMHDDRCTWRESGNCLRGYAREGPIVRYYPLPPDPPPLPRRFRCVRKECKTDFSGALYATTKETFVVHFNYDIPQYYGRTSFESNFTITEWIDP